MKYIVGKTDGALFGRNANNGALDGVACLGVKDASSYTSVDFAAGVSF